MVGYWCLFGYCILYLEKIMTKKKKHEKDDVSDLQQKCEEYLSGWKRAQADYHNLQKQTANERQKYVKMANEDLIRELLPVYDNMKIAVEHIPEDQKKIDWVIGVEHIKNQLQKFLENQGVEEIIPKKDDDFNPELHDAVERAEADSEAAGEGSETIKGVLKQGYKLNGKVIVAAKVVV